MGRPPQGWQVAYLATPLAVQAGTDYVVSVGINAYYADIIGGLASSIGSDLIVTDGPGLFGAQGTIPTQSYNSSNYFESVVFDAAGTAGRLGPAHASGRRHRRQRRRPAAITATALTASTRGGRLGLGST